MRTFFLLLTVKRNRYGNGYMMLKRDTDKVDNRNNGSHRNTSVGTNTSRAHSLHVADTEIARYKLRSIRNGERRTEQARKRKHLIAPALRRCFFYAHLFAHVKNYLYLCSRFNSHNL